MYRIDGKYHHTEKTEEGKDRYVYALKGVPDAIVFYKNFVENECYQPAYCTDIKEYIFKTVAVMEDDIQIGCVIESGKHKIYSISPMRIALNDFNRFIASVPEHLQKYAVDRMHPALEFDKQVDEIKRKRKAC